MKTLITLALLVAASPALADDAPVPGNVIVATAPAAKTLGVDGIAVVPVGDYAHAADFAAGAGARLEVPAGTGFVTGRISALFHASDLDGGLTIVPIYAGYRQPINGDFYLAGELGLTLAWFTVDTNFGRMTDSDSDVGGALFAGIRRGPLDVRGGLFLPNFDDVGLMASAGYDFVAF